MRIARPFVVLAVLLVAFPARGGVVLTQEPCPGTTSGAGTAWKQISNDVLENLLFADGHLWVSDGTASSILRIDPAGNSAAAVTGIPSPGGLALGPDGRIYAGWGNSAGNALSRNGQAKVIQFAPSAPSTYTDYASGFNMANGMTFGPNDDLFISNDFDAGLIRIPRTYPSYWSLVNDTWGTNGLVVDSTGTFLYAAITFDQRSPIEKIQLSDGADLGPAAQLTFGVVSLKPAVYDGDPEKPLLGVKGLDDMTLGGNGKLYVVANGTGELLKVDPGNGEACLIAGGLRNPSSVRIAPPGAFAADAGITFYVTEFSGAIRRIVYTPTPVT